MFGTGTSGRVTTMLTPRITVANESGVLESIPGVRLIVGALVLYPVAALSYLRHRQAGANQSGVKPPRLRGVETPRCIH